MQNLSVKFPTARETFQPFKFSMIKSEKERSLRQKNFYTHKTRLNKHNVTAKFSKSELQEGTR